MMRNCVIFFLICLLAGCEKVIDIQTDDLPPRIVIEANMSDAANDCRVIVTRSIPLGEPTEIRGVSGAVVSIREDGGQPVSLTETTPGVYRNALLRARQGRSYTLSVRAEGRDYTSTVTVPPKVPFDSLSVIDFSAFGNTRKLANVIFQDPEGVPNSYRFLQFKNGVYNPNIFIVNDDYSDGRLININLTFFDDSESMKIFPGDTVLVEMQCIDPSVYLYFNSLNRSSTGGNEVAAPGNAVSNISGGALGYFNAYTREERTVIAE